MSRQRALAAMTALMLTLAGCAASAPPPPLLVPVGIGAEPLARAVLLYGREVPGVRFAPRDAAASDAFAIVAPSQVPSFLGHGFAAIGAACARAPESLLWHGEGPFAWGLVGEQPLYAAPGSDPAALEVALSRYRGVLADLRAPLWTPGGVLAFLHRPESFLLAPEPLASALIANGQARLAQALPDELGPFPSCIVVARQGVLRRDPLLAVALLREIDQSIFTLRTGRPAELALRGRPIWPTTSFRGIERALAVARESGIWSDSAYLSAADLSAELAEMGWTLPDGGLRDRYAREALQRPFGP